MEIILIENVDNLGLRGDTVKVKDGYARNFLIPKRMAIEATEGNKKQINQQRKKIESQKVKDRSESEVFKGILEGLHLTVSRKVGEQGVLYGSVTMQDISNLLAEKGHEIDKRKVTVDQVIKTPGEYSVSIRIHPEVKAVIKLTVYSEEQWEEMEAQKNAAAAAAAEIATEAPAPIEETKVEAAPEEPAEAAAEVQPEPKEGE